MVSFRNVLLTLGVCATAVAAALNVAGERARRRQLRQQRQQVLALQRWEDEGGNTWPSPVRRVRARRR